jgi:Rieske Fe-S protein
MERPPDHDLGLDSVGEPFQVPDVAEDSRRNFFVSTVAVVSGVVAGVVPAAMALFTFCDPLRRLRRTPQLYSAEDEQDPSGFVRVCSVDALTEDTAPQRFPVVSDRIDAWNFTPAQPIGAVFVQRTGPQSVRVFNATCPHAGCSVACDGQSFLCPCHNSSFNLDGTKRVSTSGKENPSPRDMDTLEVDLDRMARGEVWVDYVNFYTGREEKIPKL